MQMHISAKCLEVPESERMPCNHLNLRVSMPTTIQLHDKE